MRPITVPQYVKEILNKDNDSLTKNIQACYPKLYKGNPLVTIVIPAYNEEKNILYTLLSIAQNITDKSVEIIVVNNNSKDNTEQIVKATGVTCINEPTPGVKHARNAGLHAASSEFIINADADTLYPPTWIETMINPLINKQGVALSYGRFAFLPPVYEKRWQYFIYENFADVLRLFKKWFKEEAMNVYGCNSAFRRAHCLQVNGYEHPPGSNEDGWLAVKLRNNGFGRLLPVYSPKAIAWTGDRHLQNDGGLIKAFTMRLKGSVK